jgi:hypothetical protein
MQPNHDTIPAAVLFCDDSASLFGVLTEAVAGLQRRGIAVGGLLQRRGAPAANGKDSLWLDDIQTGASLRLDEDRGTGAASCVVDTAVLAQGAAMLRRALDAGARVAIVNRFGSFEAQGGGLRAELADALCLGVAVLIPLRRSRLPDLELFLGGSPAVLPHDADAIAAWALTAAGWMQEA